MNSEGSTGAQHIDEPLSSPSAARILTSRRVLSPLQPASQGHDRPRGQPLLPQQPPGGGGGLFLHAVGCVTRRVPAVLAGPTTNTPEVWEKEVYAVRPQINEPIPRPVHQSRGRGETIDLVVGPSVVLA